MCVLYTDMCIHKYGGRHGIETFTFTLYSSVLIKKKKESLETHQTIGCISLKEGRQRVKEIFYFHSINCGNGKNQTCKYFAIFVKLKLI